MTLNEILKKYWGYDNFRPLQKEIIESVLKGEDTLGLLPTGGGKSIIFQTAGLAFEKGVTLVVSPLISLMKDQVDNLKRRRIKAVYFHSGMKPFQKRMAWEQVFNGKARFIYLSPERLQNKKFIQDLRNIDVNLIVVDEAHCISQWGYDFRPSYLQIINLRKLKPDVNILALTATATPVVIKDIMDKLSFKNDNIFIKSFKRSNLNYIVREKIDKVAELLHILYNTKGSAIVYVRSRKKSMEISNLLNSKGIKSNFYHAGLEFDIKEQRQNEWIRGGVRVMVATNAFGMGIDKPDVRLVVHYGPPPSIEEYYQEAGRAGRDGKKSYAVLLIKKNDIASLKKHLTETFPPRDFIRKIYEKICVFLNISIGEGFDLIKEFDIKKFCQIFKFNEKQSLSALRLLCLAGYLDYIEDPDSRSRIKILIGREELYHLNNLSKNAEKVLESVLRLYTGLFTDYSLVSELEIENLSKLSKQEVYSALLELARSKIISYIPKSSVPVIYFPTSREETSEVKIGKNIYEQRKSIMENRLNSIIEYSVSNKKCREKIILEYLGEINNENCGYCDFCRDNKTTSAIKLDPSNILTIIENSNNCGVSLLFLNSLFKDKNQIISILNFLINEGWIKFENGLYFKIK